MKKILLLSTLIVSESFSYQPSKALNDYMNELTIEVKKTNPNFK